MEATGSKPSTDLTLDEIESIAQSKLSKDALRILGAAETGSSYRRNSESFRRILLKQRVFHGYSDADTALELFGQRIETPILVAPIGSYSQISGAAESDVISGTLESQSMLFVSYYFKSSLEQIASSPHPPLAWQAYFTNGYDDVRTRIKQAESLGFAAVGATVDGVQPVKIGDDFVPGRGIGGTSVSIDEIEKIRKETSLPFFVKGIMNAEDAKSAVDAGADVIIVSNHGGRVADYSIATIEALPEVVRAVGNRSTILVDSGFRRGTDVLKALALGAKAVLLGRPIFWGAAAFGSSGVHAVISKLTEELRRSMIICGVPSLDKITEKVIIRE